MADVGLILLSLVGGPISLIVILGGFALGMLSLSPGSAGLSYLAAAVVGTVGWGSLLSQN